MLRLKQKGTGFTLIELIVVLAVVAIILVVAVPRMRVSPRGKVTTAANELMAISKFTKAVALKSGKVSVLCVYNTSTKECESTVKNGQTITKDTTNYSKLSFGAGVFSLSSSNPAQRVITLQKGLTYKVAYKPSVSSSNSASNATNYALFYGNGSRLSRGRLKTDHIYQDDGSYSSTKVNYNAEGFMAAIYCITVDDEKEKDPDINKPWQRQVVIDELGDVQLYKECTI